MDLLWNEIDRAELELLKLHIILKEGKTLSVDFSGLSYAEYHAISPKLKEILAGRGLLKM